MCGVCGEITFYSRSVRFETIQGMCRVLAHRGPDDTGMVFFEGNHSVEIKCKNGGRMENGGFEVGLGHRRLSIIDLSEAAHQPMCNEDGSLWIVFNGEIYNFQELKRELEKKGHVFRSMSDTETILHAYEEWDVDCLKRFRGMFSFGIWDSKHQRLFLARDRLGKKPLVYFHKGAHLAFASEIKAILQVPGIEKKMNIYALHDYLTLQYVPSPETIFVGIKKLPPAHYLLFDSSGNIKVERYWNLHFNSTPKQNVREPKLCEMIRHELEESVKIRLISDVPLGAFLSGGIDSSIVVGLMAKLSGSPVKTFSIGFEEKDFDELSYARLAAEHFGTDHHEFIVKPNAIEILPRLVWHYNEPFADASAIATYYVANVTRRLVTVVLTGDAGDENFAGYGRYLRSKWVALFTRLPETLRKEFMPAFARFCSSFHWREKSLNRLADFMESLCSHQGRNYAEQVKIFNTQEKSRLYTDDLANQLEGVDSLNYLSRKYEEGKARTLIDKLLYVDIHSYLPEDLLVKMDIATMANSLEARAPFLDHQFMECVSGIPAALKLKGSQSKFILKKAFSDLLPEAILNRKKMGFGVPVTRWFRNELRNYVYELLLDNRAVNRGYFKPEGIKRLLDEHMVQRYDHSSKIWALLVLEIWFRVFMDQEKGLGSFEA